MPVGSGPLWAAPGRESERPVTGEGPVWGPGSDTDALGQQLAVIRRVAEQQLGALGPLEVEVS